MSRYVVGVTGGIGSGKTTVTNAFMEHGIDVVDADVIARDVVAPGSAALAQIREHFGADILLSDGSLNRAELRQRIFADNAQKEWLNQLLHPLIRQRIEAQLKAATSPYCILSAPLLLENNLNRLCDRVLVVDVSEDTQVQRTTRRDNTSEEQVRAIMDAQLERQARFSAADDIITNDCSLAFTHKQVASLHQQYLRLANRKTH